MFLALPKGLGNFEIVDSSDGSPATDWFVAVRPAAGADSSSFRAILPSGTVNSARQTVRQRLPVGFLVVESSGVTAEGWPQRIRCEADNAEMVFVPGGVFLFGNAEFGDDGQSENALPAQPVELDPYYIDVTEVTLEQYRKFTEAQRKERLIPPPANAEALAKHPALGVAWGDAIRYAEWAGKALPTEAEWELAARGAESFDCPWGNGRAVWAESRSAGQIDPVGSFSTDRSVFGVLDMAGNAKEWTFDLYSNKPADASLSRGGAAVKNPTGPRRASVANHRVVKGSGPHWELWHRTSAGMSAPTPDLGFRCVLRVSPSGGTVENRSRDGDRPSESPAPATAPSRPQNPRPPAGEPKSPRGF